MIFAVACAVYLNTLSHGFVYDDNSQIVENPWIRSAKFLPEIFSKSVWSFQAAPTMSNYYRPLMHAIALFNYSVFGLHAWGYHLLNILFHAGNSALVFLVASRLLPGSHLLTRKPPAAPAPALFTPPFVAALLFATHPIHTEAVAWIAAVPELSFTLFGLLSFYFFIVSRDGSTAARALSVTAFFLALLCKETALTLVLLMAVYDAAFPRGESRILAHARRYLPYAIVAVLYLLLRLHALGSLVPVMPVGRVRSGSYFINAFPLFALYLEKLVVPLHLNAFHTYRPIASLLEPRGILSLLAAAACAVFAALAYTRSRVVFFGLMLVAVPLLPAFAVPSFSPAPFSERYLYLPSVGFSLLLAAAFMRLRGAMPRNGRPAVGLVLALAASYAALTIARNPVWKNDLVLFADIVEKSPAGEIPRGMFGIALMKAGRYDEAIREFNAVLKLNPDSANGHYNLGLSLLKKGSPAAAAAALQKALALTPDDPDTHRYLGIAYAQTGRTAEAVAHYGMYDRSQPDSQAVCLSLGKDLENRGALASAIPIYREALASGPERADLQYALENAYIRTGQIGKATGWYRELVDSSPGNALYRNLLGVAYAQGGAYDLAIEQFATAIRLDPAVPAYRKNHDAVLDLKKSAGGAGGNP